jgi:tRNA nucleotidyltransferase (CCA-adding enzyme)
VAKGVPQDPAWHPEGDVWVHTLQVVDAARTALDLTATPGEQMSVLLGALCHDMGKPATTALIDGRWRALGHEGAGVPPTAAFLDRLNVHTIDGFDVRRQVLALVEHHLAPLAWAKRPPSASAFRRLSHKVDLMLLSHVSMADITGRAPRPLDTSPVDWFRERVRSLDLRDGPPPAILKGRHLIALGVKPGVRMGELLRAVYEQQMDGSVTSLDEAMAAAKTIGTL